MKDVELRQECLVNGKFKDYMLIRSAMKLSNRFDLLYDHGNVNFPLFRDSGFTDDETTVCERIRTSVSKQRKKIEAHISFYMGLDEYKVYFCTFNFSDDTLSRTTADTRKQKVRRLLSSFCDDFILNIDYGSKTDREHFHAVIMVRSDVRPTSKNGHFRFRQLEEYSEYGFYDVKRVKFNYSDSEKLSRYLAKLTMHSVKVRQSYVSVKKGSPYQMWQKLKIQCASAWLRATDPRSFAGFKSLEDALEIFKKSEFGLKNPLTFEWLSSLSSGSMKQLRFDWFSCAPSGSVPAGSYYPPEPDGTATGKGKEVNHDCISSF